MTSAAICLCLLVASLWSSGLALEAKIDAQDAEADRLTSRFLSLRKRLDGIEASRQNAEQAGDDGNNRLSNKFGTGCGDSEFAIRCGDSAECSIDIVRCDGVKDCRNGADEENCENPIKKGDVFIGGCGLNTCGNTVKRDTLFQDRWVFTGVKSVDWFGHTEDLEWDYFPSEEGTIGAETGYLTGISTIHRGSGKIFSVFEDGGGIVDVCQLFNNNDVLECTGYTSGMFGVGDGCYFCRYHRQK